MQLQSSNQNLGANSQVCAYVVFRLDLSCGHVLGRLDEMAQTGEFLGKVHKQVLAAE